MFKSSINNLQYLSTLAHFNMNSNTKLKALTTETSLLELLPLPSKIRTSTIMALLMLTAFFHKFPPTVMIATWLLFFIPSFTLKHMLASKFITAHPLVVENLNTFTLSGGILLTCSLLLVIVSSLVQLYNVSTKVKADLQYVQRCTYIEKDLIGRNLILSCIATTEEQENKLQYVEHDPVRNTLVADDSCSGLNANLRTEHKMPIIMKQYEEIDLELGLGTLCPLEYVHSYSYDGISLNGSVPPSPPRTITHSDFDHPFSNISIIVAAGESSSDDAISLDEDQVSSHDDYFTTEQYESSECDLEIGKIPTFTLAGPTLEKKLLEAETKHSLEEISSIISEGTSNFSTSVSAGKRSISTIRNSSAPRKSMPSPIHKQNVVLRKLTAYAKDNFNSKDSAAAYIDAMV